MKVELSDLVDAGEVARICHIKQRENVGLYQSRYADMPRPVIDMGRGNPKLWLRPQITRWQAQREREQARRQREREQRDQERGRSRAQSRSGKGRTSA